MLQHDVNWQAYTGVLEDPGLEAVVEDDSMTLYRVRSWSGSVVDTSGQAVESDSPLAVARRGPVGRGDVGGPVPERMAPGDRIGHVTPACLVALPSGSWAGLVLVRRCS